MNGYGKVDNERKITTCEIVSYKYIDSLRAIHNFIERFDRKELIGQYNIEMFEELFENLKDKNYEILHKY